MCENRAKCEGAREHGECGEAARAVPSAPEHFARFSHTAPRSPSSLKQVDRGGRLGRPEAGRSDLAAFSLAPTIAHPDFLESGGGDPPFLAHFCSIDRAKLSLGTFRHSDEENERRAVIEVSVASAILA